MTGIFFSDWNSLLAKITSTTRHGVTVKVSIIYCLISVPYFGMFCLAGENGFSSSLSVFLLANWQIFFKDEVIQNVLSYWARSAITEFHMKSSTPSFRVISGYLLSVGGPMVSFFVFICTFET